MSSYVNPALVDPQAFTSVIHGFRVDKAAATLPQTATQNLFTVAGGRIAILGILGQVTVVLGATATNGKLLSTPTVGTAVDICAVLAIASKEAGTLFGITGIFGDAMVGANAGATVLQQRPVVVPAGVIGFNCSANNTGSTKWTLWYVPLDVGATAVSA
jgi:hypothetical protein